MLHIFTAAGNAGAGAGKRSQARPGTIRVGSRSGRASALRHERSEGTLSSRTDSLFVVNVNSVSYFNGLSNKWSGEPVNVGAKFVQEARLRQFSRVVPL